MKIKDGIPYRLLPGYGWRTGFLNPATYRLWLAPDHLLSLTISHYSETNKRFYFKDIQALVISNNNKGRNRSIVLGIITAILGLITLSLFRVEDLVVAGVFMLISTGIMLLALVINMIRGQTCSARLHTAVQVEELPSLRYLRTAKKVAATLKEAVESAQGPLAPEELQTRGLNPLSDNVEIQASPYANPVGIGMPMSRSTPNTIRHEHGKYHTALFIMLIILALSCAIDIFWQHRVKNAIDTLMPLPFIFFGFMALKGQHNSDMPKAIKNIAWASVLSFVGAFFVSIYVLSFYRLSQMPFKPGENPFSHGLDPWLGDPVFVVWWSIEAAVYSILALIGLIRLNKFQADYEASQRKGQ